MDVKRLGLKEIMRKTFRKLIMDHRGRQLK